MPSSILMQSNWGSGILTRKIRMLLAEKITSRQVPCRVRMRNWLFCQSESKLGCLSGIPKIVIAYDDSKRFRTEDLLHSESLLIGDVDG